jgi:hypothetical protein
MPVTPARTPDSGTADLLGKGTGIMNVVKKAVTGCALAVTGLLLAAGSAGSALAGTTVGQTGPPLTDVGFAGGSETVQTDAAMPAGGTVTSLNTQAGSCPFGAGTYNFQVLRPLGGGQYQVLGDTGNQADPCDSQMHSYPVSIPVQAGDVIGAYVVSSWEGLLPPVSSQAFDFIPEPAVGDTITLTNEETGPGTLDESATLQTASDLAATLVSDAKGLPPGTSLPDKATVIQTAVTAGNTATACADITNFLGLVKAQTGKKLTTAQVSLLTTDADNLATALGC